MARPKKSQSVEFKSEESVSSATSDDLYINLIEKLEKEINELKSKLSTKDIVPSSKPVVENNEYDDDDEFEKYNIPQDTYIKVISLCPYQLNLSTKGMGRGKIFTFHEFGQSKRILYSDLVEILESHQAFLKDGLFYIADKRVIRKNGLDDIYSNILNKDSIEKIISGSTNDAVSLFKSASEKQQEIIVDMLIEKVQSDPDSVDLNLVDKISRASGIKIQERAEEARTYFGNKDKKEQ